MTLKEWKEQNPDASFTTVWAADTLGGFGKKGWGAYGNCDDCDVIRVETKQLQQPRGEEFKILYLWYTKLWGPCPEVETA